MKLTKVKKQANKGVSLDEIQDFWFFKIVGHDEFIFKKQLCSLGSYIISCINNKCVIKNIIEVRVVYNPKDDICPEYKCIPIEIKEIVYSNN